ncbi:uncharacterized protein LOC119403186 [Rhipicephalus sanguineus]|uniref:uncharacterized protein LOC119403186 n=1 Tax=Rhipicephalus sanguineus TaxID=34632 RepID=UPI0020C4FB87|nr:uncharacterized protein LOC119403186 [Rhipicephalus sanguineus]
MEKAPPRQKACDTRRSGDGDTKSRSGESTPSSELMESPQRREHAQSSKVSALENGGITGDSATKSNGKTHVSNRKEVRGMDGQGAEQVESAGDSSTDSSGTEDDGDWVHEVERKTHEGHAAISTSKIGKKPDNSFKISVDKDITGHTSEVKPIEDEIASPRTGDLAQADSHASAAEQRSTECRKNDGKDSETTLNNAEIAGTSSCADDTASEKPATAESETSEKQSGMRGRWSIWNQYISHELSMPVRRKPPPEGVGPPVSYTAVGQRLLQIFRERQETAQSIAGESSAGSNAVMREMLPELRAPENRTLQECEEELAKSAATTTSRGSEEMASQTSATDSQKKLGDTIGPTASTPTDGAVKPLGYTAKFVEDSENTTSLSAETTSVEHKDKLANSSAAKTKVHQHQSPLPETIPQDCQDKQPQPSTTVPADVPTLSPRTSAVPPDCRQGHSTLSHVGLTPHVLEEQPASASTECNIQIPNVFLQSRASAFSTVRKALLEKNTPRLASTPTSSAKLPDENPEAAGKSEPTFVRKLDFCLDTSLHKKETSPSLQRGGKHNLSSGSEAADEASPVRPPACKKRADETKRVEEPSDTSDESISSPQDSFHERFFRAIYLAPVSDASGKQLSRPVALRAPLTALTVPTCTSEASHVSKQSQPVVKMLTSDSSSSPGTSTDSPSATAGDSKRQSKSEETPSGNDSDKPRSIDDRRRRSKAEREDTPSDSDLDDSKAFDDHPSRTKTERGDKPSGSQPDGQKTFDNRPRGTVTAHEDSPSDVDAESSNSPDDPHESSEAEHEDVPSGSDLDISEIVDQPLRGTKAEREDTPSGSDSDDSKAFDDHPSSTKTERGDKPSGSQPDGPRTFDNRPRGTVTASEDSPSDVDAESSNSPDDPHESSEAEREDVPSGSDLYISGIVDQLLRGTKAEPLDTLLECDLYLSETDDDQRSGTKNESEDTATASESLDWLICDEQIISTEDEHGDSPFVDSEKSNSAEDNFERSEAGRKDAPSGSDSDNLETSDGKRKSTKANRNDMSPGNYSDDLKTVGGGWSPTESSENKAATPSTKEVAGHFKPKLEEGKVSCSGRATDQSGYTSDESSNVSTRATGSASSLGSGNLALLAGSLSDDEVPPQNVESSCGGADDVRP